MDLGSKIKQLRIDKMMTQKELAGNEITRNMLSQIENGCAQPSLSTILYLSKKLGVPAGYLLSEGDEEFIYTKTNAMRNIKRAYADRQHEICRDMCLSFDVLDDELELILADCCLGLAVECALQGKLHRACRLLDEAWTHSEATAYDTSMQKNRIKICFAFLCELSPTLDSYEVDTYDLEHISDPNFYSNAFDKYAILVFNINEGKELDEGLLDCDFSDTDKLLIDHLIVKNLIAKREFEKARRLLISIIDGPVTPPRLLLYLACCDMEICCREINDYKGAYEFANNKLEILEHMLVED